MGKVKRGCQRAEVSEMIQNRLIITIKMEGIEYNRMTYVT